LPKDFPSRFSEEDLYFFREGTHSQLYERFGAHPGVLDGAWGTSFAVWAPRAERVTLIGDFNAWNPEAHPMRQLVLGEQPSGIWETFAPGVGKGALYKFHIESRSHRGYSVDKTDPFARLMQVPPETASIVHDATYRWSDGAYLEARKRKNPEQAPMSILEVHLGGFRRIPEENDRFLSYRELGNQLGEYASERGFTHVELMPVMEHPFYGSWGYQVTGYFAASHRYGKPEDLMALVDQLHHRGIGVLFDWVPSHFPSDEHGLAYFDGAHLYEHPDPRRGWHPDWKSCVFDYGRREVQSFLISSARFWLDRFHGDGLRVDGVASMLYLDYSRKDGEWVPNERGGRENLEAVSLLRRMNDTLNAAHPDCTIIAEESTAFPMVSHPTQVGGLGFRMKWDLGWMHDTLRYLARDPIHRRWHHQEVTFRPLYAFDERFVLPLSHDEVVHGKGSLLNKMPGDRWQKFANLRLLFAYQHGQPGKKLLFMGGDFGQWREFNHDTSLDWHLLEQPDHAGLSKLIGDLNRLHVSERSLHVRDTDRRGFRWIDGTDAEHSMIAFLRLGEDGDPPIACIYNFTPVPRYGIPFGVPTAGAWTEVLNSDAAEYGGSGVGNLGEVDAKPGPMHGFAHVIEVTLPPLGAVFLRGPVLSDADRTLMSRPISAPRPER
jgi:1,4-alpha-glucan branching enzyme